MTWIKISALFFAIITLGCSHQGERTGRSLASAGEISKREGEIYDSAFNEMVESLLGKQGPSAELDAREICKNLKSQGNSEDREWEKFVKDPGLILKRRARRNACQKLDESWSA